MNCPKCNIEVNIKKNNLFNCKCGAVLIAVQIYKKIIVVDLNKNEGEK